MSFTISGPGGGQIVWWADRFYVGTGQGVRRVLSDGAVDASFIGQNTGPYFSSLQGGYNYLVYPDGRLLLCGYHTLYDSIRGFEGGYNLIWFSNEGYLDTTRIHRQSNGVVYSVFMQPDGKIVCGGTMSEYEGQPTGGVIRVHPNGDLDTTFQTQVTWSWPLMCHTQPDGKLLLGGSFKWGNNPDTLSLIRVLPNGDLDSTFNNDLQTLFTPDPDPGWAPISDYVLLDDGRGIVTGSFDRVDGEVRGGIALIDSAGNLLDDFFNGPGCGLFWNGFNYSGTVAHIVQSPTGSYYIHGGYAGYDDGLVGDTAQRFISRLHGLNVGFPENQSYPTNTPLHVWPNPGSDHLALNWASGKEGEEVRLYDLVGRLVLMVQAAGSETRLEPRHLSAGCYTAVWTNSTGSVAAQWIKQ